MTTSRLLASLLDQARTAPNKLEWARSVCRAAAHNARSGRFDDSIAKITQVRAEFGPNLHAHVASWLMLAEGVLHWCQFEAQPAYDRIMRAHALAVAFRAEAALPSCAAWMALVEFNLSQYAKMAQHLDDAFTLARPDDHQARGRATLVLADAYHLASGYPLARPWYEQARRHATTEGDEATLGAMLFNVAVSRMVNVRLEEAFNALPEAEADRLDLETGGSMTFDALTRNKSQEPWRHLLHARLLTLQRKFQLALDAFAKTNVAAMNNRSMQPLVKIDQAWCLIHLGEQQKASELAAEALEEMPKVTDPDDRAFGFKRLSQLASMAGHTDLASALDVQAQDALEEHRAAQKDLLALLNGIRASATM